MTDAVVGLAVLICIILGALPVLRGIAGGVGLAHKARRDEASGRRSESRGRRVAIPAPADTYTPPTATKKHAGKRRYRFVR